MDPRSLAVFRMGIGALLLADLAVRATDLRAMYTDDGMFPRSEICYHYTTIWNWSFHFASGAGGYQALLFGLAAVLAVALLTGFETRLATIGSWFMLVSLQHRVPPVLSGADLLLRMLLFWGMFLPLGQVWSLDRRRSGVAAVAKAPVLSVASAAILIQMGLLYLFSAIFKSNGAWWRGEVVAGALTHDFFASRFGTHLLQFPWLLSGLTWGTLVLEWAAPILLFFPKGTARMRLVMVGALAAMHLGISLCMNVDLFTPVCLAGLSLFLPAEFWNSGLFARFSQSVDSANASVAAGRIAAPRHPWFAYVPQGACLVALLYVLAINLNGLPSHPLTATVPRQHGFLWTGFGLGQKWSMFDEAPSRSGWYVARARLNNGAEVDLLREGLPIDWEKPRFPAGIYPNFRWRKLFREMAYADQVGYQVFREPVARFLCRDWDRRHAAEMRIAEFELIYCDDSNVKAARGSAPQVVVRERLAHLDFTGGEDGLAEVSGS